MPHLSAIGAADQVVLLAVRRDTALDGDLARRLAERALAEVDAGVAPDDAPELARRLLAAEPEAGASPASVVAAAVAEVLTAG